MTTVTNLSTGETMVYSLSPEKAVVCAFEQETRKNNNTWEYDFTKARISASGKTVSCGDWCAMNYHAEER